MAQVAIFKQIFDKVRNNLNYHWFYSELKRHNVSHYIYYLATEETLLKQEFFGGLQISTNKKDITIPLIIHYSLLRTFRTLHKYFRTKS